VGKRKNDAFWGIFSVSVLITVFLQIVRAFKDFQFISGHGGKQSRYYICIMMPLAYMMTTWIRRWVEEKKGKQLLLTGGRKGAGSSSEKQREVRGGEIRPDGKTEKEISLDLIFTIGVILLLCFALYGTFFYYLLHETKAC
jgi:hypothetical protein